jgi:mannose-6-phosphate isomerase-like protein (cupin superfamily)
MAVDKSIQPQVVQLKTQLVKKGRSRILLSETDNSTFRIHCYATGTGENALHAHLNEDHTFVVLQGTATFTGIDEKPFTLGKNGAVVLPKGCFYQFANYGQPIGGRAAEGYGEPELIENAFFE